MVLFIFPERNKLREPLKNFTTNQKDLILLKVETLNLDHLVWEQASDGNMFPHLYSHLIFLML